MDIDLESRSRSRSIRNLNPNLFNRVTLWRKKEQKNYAICTLQTIIEQALEVQKEVYLYFIEYTKTFGKVQPDDIITQLTQLKIDGKDLQMIKNMY